MSAWSWLCLRFLGICWWPTAVTCGLSRSAHVAHVSAEAIIVAGGASGQQESVYAARRGAQAWRACYRVCGYACLVLRILSLDSTRGIRACCCMFCKLCRMSPGIRKALSGTAEVRGCVARSRSQPRAGVSLAKWAVAIVNIRCPRTLPRGLRSLSCVAEIAKPVSEEFCCPRASGSLAISSESPECCAEGVVIRIKMRIPRMSPRGL
jgi:hypothetical protein